MPAFLPYAFAGGSYWGTFTSSPPRNADWWAMMPGTV
jgi:hypothetical protein